jgi:hypothetical protein
MGFLYRLNFLDDDILLWCLYSYLEHGAVHERYWRSFLKLKKVFIIIVHFYSLKFRENYIFLQPAETEA